MTTMRTRKPGKEPPGYRTIAVPPDVHRKAQEVQEAIARRGLDAIPAEIVTAARIPGDKHHLGLGVVIALALASLERDLAGGGP